MGQRYVVFGTIAHNDARLEHGTEVTEEQFSPEEFARLLAAGTLLSPAAGTEPAALDEKLTHLTNENDDLRARLAALEAEIAVKNPPKPGKADPKSDA